MKLRQQTKNSRSLDDVYRELFRRRQSEAARADANSTVIGILKSQSGMKEFVEQYVEQAAAIDLRAAIAPFGLEILKGGVRTHISVASQLSRAQRDLLSKFGYNKDAQR